MLGADGDATLAFQVVVVHHAFLDACVFAEDAGGAEDGIDQRRLAVIDVGDNGQIADSVDKSHKTSTLYRALGPAKRSGPIQN